MGVCGAIMEKTISFEIDGEVEGNLLALAKEWGKEPSALAKALFTEELTAQLAGSRGIPLLRRYRDRDSVVYFTQDELAEQAKKQEAYWQSPEGLAQRQERKLLLDRLTAASNKFTQKGGAI